MISIPLNAEVGVRECIASSAPSGQAYILAADGVWRDLGTLRFNHNSGSDYVVSAVADFTAGNTANGLVEYQITVDGVQHGWFTRRTPEVFPGTQAFRASVPDRPIGIHTIALRARNFSNAAVLYNRVWITPLLVDSAETTLKNVPGGSVTVTSSWTNLAQLNIATPSSKMLYLAGFATVTSGTPLTAVQYRITSANVLDTYDDSVPDVMSDGVHITSIYKPSNTGTQTYWFQARTLGAAFTVGARELAIQTMPNLPVFASTGGSATIPNDFQWHTLVSSPWITMPQSGRGPFGSDGSGYAYFTHTGPKTYAEVRLDLETPYPSPFDHWEVGWIGVQPSVYRKLEGDVSDWEQLGLDVGLNFRMHLQMRGICPGGPALNISKSRFQVAVLPDPYGFTGASCAANPSVCCAAHPSVCSAYECTMALPLISGVPSGSCP